MNTATSQYLDLVRFIAAGFVFLSHTTGHRISGGLLWQFGSYGHEAVIVFFVLSGFVIGYTTDIREQSVTKYAVARIARIYSVAIPALFVTFVLDHIARSINPSLYSSAYGYEGSHEFFQFLSGLFFTNELWGYHTPVGSDWSYWSLGYEVWYYVLFGIMVFTVGWWRLVGILIIAVLTGPKICLMFPIWLLGLAGYKICSRATIPPVVGLLLFFASFLGGYCYEHWFIYLKSGIQSVEFGEIPKYYTIAALCFLNIVGFRSLSARLPSSENSATGTIRWLAGATFSLYLFHEPLVRFLATLSPFAPGSLEGRILVLGGTIAGVFLAAEATERRKTIWRRGVSFGFASISDVLSRFTVMRRTPS